MSLLLFPCPLLTHSLISFFSYILPCMYIPHNPSSTPSLVAKKFKQTKYIPRYLDIIVTKRKDEPHINPPSTSLPHELTSRHTQQKEKKKEKKGTSDCEM
ncbi:hypothetical protein F5X99DRAFT_119285 [Biscogniauxia marginata]|nr:hypothetical protein F5X99DRAFT_119285 [Biscogniauxia marginata]